VSGSGNPTSDFSAGVRSSEPAGELREEMIWAQLKTVRDPEIPVNIVDLGLVYSVATVPAEGGKHIDLRMTLTAPGCAMSDVIKREIETKLGKLPEVSGVHVEIVFDPPWTPAKMSEAAKLAMGLDMDFGAKAPDKSSFRILR
jgi:metal-sulfur cluster biosynthetic enzyme